MHNGCPRPAFGLRPPSLLVLVLTAPLIRAAGDAQRPHHDRNSPQSGSDPNTTPAQVRGAAASGSSAAATRAPQTDAGRQRRPPPPPTASGGIWSFICYTGQDMRATASQSAGAQHDAAPGIVEAPMYRGTTERGHVLWSTGPGGTGDGGGGAAAIAPPPCGAGRRPTVRRGSQHAKLRSSSNAQGRIPRRRRVGNASPPRTGYVVRRLGDTTLLWQPYCLNG